MHICNAHVVVNEFSRQYTLLGVFLKKIVLIYLSLISTSYRTPLSEDLVFNKPTGVVENDSKMYLIKNLQTFPGMMVERKRKPALF